MFDFTPEQLGNIEMIGAALLAGGVAFWPKIQEIFKNFKFPFFNTSKTVDLDQYSDHDILQILIERCKDKEGLMLLAAYGKFLYEEKVPKEEKE